MDWEKGQLQISHSMPRSLTIEDKPEPKSSNIGGTTQHNEPILAINPEYVPLPSIKDNELVIESEDSDKSTPLY